MLSALSLSPVGDGMGRNADLTRLTSGVPTTGKGTQQAAVFYSDKGPAWLCSTPRNAVNGPHHTGDLQVRTSTCPGRMALTIKRGLDNLGSLVLNIGEKVVRQKVLYTL